MWWNLMMSAEEIFLPWFENHFLTVFMIKCTLSVSTFVSKATVIKFVRCIILKHLWKQEKRKEGRKGYMAWDLK